MTPQGFWEYTTCTVFWYLHRASPTSQSALPCEVRGSSRHQGRGEAQNVLHATDLFLILQARCSPRCTMRWL